MTMDAFNLVAVAPDMTELERCFREALARLGSGRLRDRLPRTPTDQVPPSATRPRASCSTSIFPEAAGIFSIKPLVGHCQAAGAAVEVMATIYAYQTGYIPAPPQVAPGHPRLVDGLTPRRPGPMIKSSIGLGGYNWLG